MKELPDNEESIFIVGFWGDTWIASEPKKIVLALKFMSIISVSFEALSFPSTPTNVTSQSKIKLLEKACMQKSRLTKSALKGKRATRFIEYFNVIVYRTNIKFSEF